MTHDTFLFHKPQITLSQIETLIAIASSRTVTEAAGKVFKTQSAVTKEMSVLEKNLNCRLFDRKPGGHEHQISLTKKGEEFLVLVRNIPDIINEAVKRAGSVKNETAVCNTQHRSRWQT